MMVASVPTGGIASAFASHSGACTVASSASTRENPTTSSPNVTRPMIEPVASAT